MKHGFLKVAAITPKIKVADTQYNAKQILQELRWAAAQGAKLVVFPELCLTGYTCGDLFLQETLLEGALEALAEVADGTVGSDALVFVGLPLAHGGKLYNVAAAVQNGEVLAFIPKSYIPAYGEFYETRYFTPGMKSVQLCTAGEWEVPIGTEILFQIEEMKGLLVGCEICEDLWSAKPPSVDHALAGALVLVNLSASDETTGKDAYRELLVESASARLLAAYIYCSAGEGESTQDLVFGGHQLIAENGTILAESKRFAPQNICTEVDVQRLLQERRRMTTFSHTEAEGYHVILVSMDAEETKLTRRFDPLPFVPTAQAEQEKRWEEILSIQAYGLKKRLEHTGAQSAVIGISGGLDSALALLVTVRAFDLLSLKRSGIRAVTMPCFGTTDRTYDNACRLAKALGVQLEKIDIREAVQIHFRDIGQEEGKRDAAYENGQARERTQVLMDLANRCGGIVIGTGDMSELALGWATYNGDHMSMYGVNAGVPKTLVRYLVQYAADTSADGELREVLTEVLATPVSPELLPPEGGEISQKTEDLVGPYELHDFFLYYMLRCGFSPEKLYRVACRAFQGLYEKTVILKWMKVFYQRFFSQQFKRSCLPDGPKVGSVALSPRGDLRMPSDASGRLWLEQIEELS